MKFKEVEYGFCIECGERIEYTDLDISSKNNRCECGSSSIVLGSNYIRNNHKGNGVICTCLNETFIRSFHIDYDTYSKSMYKCTECNNCITIDTYRDFL